MKHKSSIFGLIAGFAISAMVISTSALQVNAESFYEQPKLKNAYAFNSGGTSAKEAGDSVSLKFSEATNKFEITQANIDQIFVLSNGHSFLDGAGKIGKAHWGDDGVKLQIVLSSEVSFPTVQVGDTVQLVGENIKTLNGMAFRGSAVIEGSFTKMDSKNCVQPTPTAKLIEENAFPAKSDNDSDEDKNDDSPEIKTQTSGEKFDDDCDDDRENKYHCGNDLHNGKLYKLEGSPTVYMLVNCSKMKPFRGIAAFKSRGLKFADVKVLSTLPAGVIIDSKPVVPAEGTLVKGSNKTVWFVDANGKKRGFISEKVFKNLGFKFDVVDQISDSDLNEIENDDNINDDLNHPNGSVVKCGNSGEVYKVLNKQKFPFASAEAFKDRGHSYSHVLEVDCGRFAYQQGAPIN